MTTATPFDRLKSALGVREDKEVAAALGMTAAAFSERKRRGAFPRDKLLALQATRPELQLDVDYVLFGQVARAARGAAAVTVNFARNDEAEVNADRYKQAAGRSREGRLLRAWHRCNTADQDYVINTAEHMASRGGKDQ